MMQVRSVSRPSMRYPNFEAYVATVSQALYPTDSADGKAIGKNEMFSRVHRSSQLCRRRQQHRSGPPIPVCQAERSRGDDLVWPGASPATADHSAT